MPSAKAFSFEPTSLACLLDNKPGVLDPADSVNLVADFDLKQDARTLNFGHLSFDRDRLADQCGAEVINLDTSAYGILTVLEMLQHEVAAGPLGVLYHERCGVDPEVLAHEADGLVLLDGALAVKLTPALSESFMFRILTSQI